MTQQPESRNDEVVKMLLEVAHKAYHALDDSEERSDGVVISLENAAELQASLDALEDLPEEPGYASCGPNNAAYALGIKEKL